jgi:hypothetical protein
MREAEIDLRNQPFDLGKAFEEIEKILGIHVFFSTKAFFAWA